MEDRENSTKWSRYANIYNPLQSGSIDGTDTTPHDRALIRAMEANYVPPSKNIATPNAEKTLFVGRLDLKTTDENLTHEFSRYGTVTQCRVVRDVVTGFSRGYAFVQFKHREDAEKARRDAHRAVLDGREILVEWENGRTMPGWIPRRLGGGFGGKKESGQLRFGGRDRPFQKPIVIQTMGKNVPSLLDEENIKPFRERDRQSIEDEESGGRPRPSRNDTKDLREGRLSSQFPRKNFSKPWNRRNTEYSSGQGMRSSRDQRDWNEREDRRYSRRSSRGSNEKEDRRYSRRSSRDSNEKEDRSYSRRFSRDANEKEDKRNSRRSSRDSNEWDSSKMTEKDQRFSSKRDRNDSSEWKDKRYYSEFSRNRGDFVEQVHKQRRLDKRDDHCGGSRDLDDQYKEESFDRRSEKKKRSRKSRDRDGADEWNDSSERKLIKVKEEDRSSNERDDMGDWEDTPERLGKDEKRSKISSKDQEDNDWEDFPEKSDTDKKRLQRLRDQSDSEEQDDGHKQKLKKKKKKHSKKSLRDRGDSDAEDDYSKKKKKKKHKKSRD